MFNQIKLRTRLFGSLGAVAFISLIGGGLNLLSVKKLTGHLTEVAGESVPELRAAMEADIARLRARRDLSRRDRQPDGQRRGDCEGIKEFHEATAGLRGSLDELAKHSLAGESRSALDAMQTALPLYINAGEALAAVIQKKSTREEFAAAQKKFSERV